MLRLSLLWTLCLFLAPVLVVKGLLLRTRALRLPEAAGPSAGTFGEAGPTLKLLSLGDSVIAGVGVEHSHQALTSQLALHLQSQLGEATDHPYSGHSVSWQAMGHNGDRLGELLARLPKAEDCAPDLVLISIGVNDVSHLTSATRWQGQVSQLIAELQSRFGAPVVFLGTPPMGEFTALPQPLRFALGVRARMLDLTLQRAARLVPGVYWFDTAAVFDADHLAADGYHPNAAANARLAEHLAATLLPQLAEHLAAPIANRAGAKPA
jgi:lysophospholipase L1-like esterase